MNRIPSFKDYLAAIPADVIISHFLSRQGHARKILSSSSIDEITRQMLTEKSIRERFARLSPAGQYAVSCAYLFGKRGLETQTVTGFDDELLGSFLVFAGKNEMGRTFLFGFQEFEARMAPLAAGVIADRTRTAVAREPSAPPPWLCLNDVAVLCVCASTGMLRMTRKGTFAKVSETAMKRFLHASHEVTFPLRVLFGFALERGLLQLDKDIFRPLPHAIIEWMGRSLAERYVDFCEYATGAVPLWSMVVVDALFAGTSRQWLCLPPFGDAAKKEARSVLMCLRYLGLIDVCKDGGSLAFTRVDSRSVEGPDRRGRIILLADFSAVLTREVLPDDLYWFSKAGSLDSFDSVYKGTILRQTINDSLSEGIDEKSLVERLETWNAPPNVLATVKEWIREFSRMYITSDATIVSADERATGQISSYGPLKHFIERVRADSVFRIKPGREQEVRNILVSMGFDPRMPGEANIRKPSEAGAAIMQEQLFGMPDGLTADMPPAMPGDAAFPQPGGATESIVPAVSFGALQDQGFRPVKSGKYGQKLKELDMSDLFHVIDYAVLMGHAVTFEYRGSPLVKKGIYTVSPVSVQKSSEPFCDALVLPGKTRKKFLLKCIIRIGVESA
jgi:hypothetical protein